MTMESLKFYEKWWIDGGVYETLNDLRRFPLKLLLIFLEVTENSLKRLWFGLFKTLI